MKRFRSLHLVALLGAICLAPSLSVADGHVSKPGPEHKLLEKFAGEWDADCEFFAPGQDEPMKFKGEYVAKMEVGGFFLMGTFKSKIEGDEGEGRGVMGYDPVKKAYTGFWLESNRPFMTTVRGKWKKPGKVFEEVMTTPGPDGKSTKSKVVTKFKDDDTMVTTTTFPVPDGAEAKMVITFTRKK